RTVLDINQLVDAISLRDLSPDQPIQLTQLRPQPFLQRELYLSAMTINGIKSDPFCVYSADNARVKAFKLMAEF
ncbi:hypothetical protein, partial [Vibrio cholerae]|uniref:hypothetical protein n=1 Tax=Vibrio cholerae TaxID=666 RepID=UPI001C11343A